MSAKWLELLKEVAPQLRRVAVLRDTAIAAGAGQLGAAQSVAPSLGVELRPVGVRDAGEIERTVTAFARETNGGLIVAAGAAVAINRELIIRLAARYRLPAVYPYRFFTTSGGLMSYGIDPNELFRLAASYVDGILKGAKPADMPVQNPDKFELVINLKTTQALGITVAPSLLGTADEVIE